MSAESEFIKLRREIEELKLTFILFSYQALTSKSRHLISGASEEEDLLLKSVKSINNNGMFIQRTHQICTTEDALRDEISSMAIPETQQMDK
jgi:hypothetical protein